MVLSGCGSEEAERKRLELQRAVDLLRFEPSAGNTLPLALSIGAAVFPHDGEVYETLLATADSRMYRDKTRRKRLVSDGLAGSDEPPRPTAPDGVSDVDLTRAAAGVL